MAAHELFILSQSCSKLRNESIDVDNRLEKLLAERRIQIQKFFPLSKFKSDGMASHKHGPATKTVSKGKPPKSLLSKRISLG